MGSNIVLKLERGEFGAKMSIFAKIGSGYEPGETPVILINKWKLLKMFWKVSKKNQNVIDSDKNSIEHL